MKRLLSLFLSVVVIVSMLCIGTVPTLAYDGSLANDSGIYFYSEPKVLEDMEANEEFIDNGDGTYSFELTYDFIIDPSVYYGHTMTNLSVLSKGGDGFLEFEDMTSAASNIMAVPIGTGARQIKVSTMAEEFIRDNEFVVNNPTLTPNGLFATVATLKSADPYNCNSNAKWGELGLMWRVTVYYKITDMDKFKTAVKAKTLTFNISVWLDKTGYQDLTLFKLAEDGKSMGEKLRLKPDRAFTPPEPLNFQITSTDDPQPATDPYYNYTGDDANGYTITFTDAYKNAILNNTDYTSDDGATTYWKANDPIKNPQYNGKTVSSAANLFSGMALSKVDLTEYNLSDTAMSNMFAGFQGTGNGIPAIGVAANDATAAKYNLTDTGIDKTTLYFGNVTILNYNDGNAYNYVYDDRATTDTDEATTAVAIGNAGNNKQFVNITGKYFAGFENPDKTDDLVTIDYSDAVKTKDLDAYLTAQQTTDKGNDVLRLQLNAKVETPNGINLSKAMAQKVTKNGTNSIRFIALIDTGYADYKETGFVLSGVGMNPTRQAGYQYKSVGTIYKKLRALDTTSNKPGVVLMDIEKMNGIFGFANGAGFEYTELKIPAGKENTTYYATPYIVLADDTIVYGETKATSFNVLVANDQKSVE